MRAKYLRVILGLIITVLNLKANSQTDTILVDFGSILSPHPWNNVTSAKTGQIGGLINVFGSITNLGIRVFDEFNAINTNGTTTPNGSLGIPPEATEDSFYGNTVDFGGDTQPTGGIELYNLNPSEQYTLTIFASRLANDNRETKYVITGANQQMLFLNASNNTSNEVTATLYPANDGIINIVASPGANNNNAYNFFYLGALKVKFKKERYLTLNSPSGGEFWQVGKVTPIRWSALNVAEVILDYSTDNGATWNNIDTVSGFLNKYDWTIPNTPSVNCLVRAISDTLISQSSSVFEIANDASKCTIVVLGSSTAAGQGPTSLDSAWVNRYRAYLYENNTSYEVINLAKGGYNTYKVIPTNTPIPPNIGIAVDTARNLTKALTYNPFAIIVNMPSNDAAMDIPVSEQLYNFKVIYDSAQLNGIQTYIATTQPRNFTTASKIQIQEDVRDSIFAIYGDFSIDFWNGFAQSNGYIVPEYNSGDGTHMNNAAHRLLLNRVVDKLIDTLCNEINVVEVKELKKDDLVVNIYPNPTNSQFHIATAEIISSIRIFNNLGVEVEKISKYEPGNTINVQDYIKGVYFVVITTPKGIVNKKIVVN